jgi:hypothetical protein
MSSAPEPGGLAMKGLAGLQAHRLPQHDHRGAIASQLSVHSQQ